MRTRWATPRPVSTWVRSPVARSLTKTSTGSVSESVRTPYATRSPSPLTEAPALSPSSAGEISSSAPVAVSRTYSSRKFSSPLRLPMVYATCVPSGLTDCARPNSLKPGGFSGHSFSELPVARSYRYGARNRVPAEKPIRLPSALGIGEP